jgi:hypothetical protein
VPWIRVAIGWAPREAASAGTLLDEWRTRMYRGSARRVRARPVWGSLLACAWEITGRRAGLHGGWLGDLANSSFERDAAVRAETCEAVGAEARGVLPEVSFEEGSG